MFPPTSLRSGCQQHGRPQQAASAQQALVKAAGLAAKATPGANRADAARIFVMIFMSCLQILIVVKLDAPTVEVAAEPAFRRRM